LFWGRKKKEVAPTIYTEETCKNCGEKKRRNFEDGDYIYKSSSSNGSVCKRCSSTNTTMITAIYGEYPPEKQKKDN
jgi:hypothetical protein